jgi:hypothetical protein
MDLYFQAASCGHIGLHGAEVGGQLWTLRAKPSALAVLFLDMVRVHGKLTDKAAQLAFPRGGYQSMVRAMVTRADASELLVALQADDEMSDDEARAMSSSIQALPPEDELLVAGEAVLNSVFQRLVRKLHAPGGVFARGVSQEVFERGLPKLRVGTALVKQLGWYFICGGGRRRLRSVCGAADEVVGIRYGSQYAHDNLKRLRRFSERTVKGYRAVLSWWLRTQGWPSVRMPARSIERPAYLSVVQLEVRSFKKAYHTTLRLCVKQSEYRAMACTEDVVHVLLYQLVVTAALDLQTAVAIVLSYALGLRVSDVHLLNRNNFRFGLTSPRADVEFFTERHKGDGEGEGFSRWLQHCHGCEEPRRAAVVA